MLKILVSSQEAEVRNKIKPRHDMLKQGGRTMMETLVYSADISWEPAIGYPDGTMCKILRTDSSGNTLTMILNLPPGFVMDDHSHVVTEHHYLLEGEYQAKGKTYYAGHYHLIPEHTDHGPFRSDSGAVLLVIWESKN